MNARYITLGLTALAIFVAFRFFLPLVLPFVLAYFFAKMVSPVIRFLTEKLKWRRRVSSVLVVVITVCAVGGFLIYVGSMVISQVILLLQKLPVYGQMADSSLEKLCCRSDRMLELSSGSSYRYATEQMAKLYTNVADDILPRLSACAAGFVQWLTKAGSGLFIFFLSTLLILLDDAFPGVNKKIRPFVNQLKTAGFAYIKAQCIIIFLIAAAISLGLFLMGNHYAILFGIAIAIFDAFPIVGSGIILIPWAILNILEKNFYHAAILVTLFAVATFLREVMEPRLFGKEVGLKPLYVLISVYVGVKLFGFGGILLGPIALTILKVTDDVTKKAL